MCILALLTIIRLDGGTCDLTGSRLQAEMQAMSMTDEAVKMRRLDILFFAPDRFLFEDFLFPLIQLRLVDQSAPV